MSSSPCLHRGHAPDRSVPSPRQAAASTATGTSEKSSSGKGGGLWPDEADEAVVFFAAESRASSSVAPNASIIWRTTRSSSSASLVFVAPRTTSGDAEARAATPPPARSASTSERSARTSRLSSDISPRSISRQSSCALRARTTAAAIWYLSASPETARLSTALRGRRRVASADEGLDAAARPTDTTPGARDVDVASASLDTAPREAGLLGVRVAPPPRANARGVADVESDSASMLRSPRDSGSHARVGLAVAPGRIGRQDVREAYLARLHHVAKTSGNRADGLRLGRRERQPAVPSKEFQG